MRQAKRLDLKLHPPTQQLFHMPGLGRGNRCKTEQALPLRGFQSCQRKTAMMTEILHCHTAVVVSALKKKEGSRAPPTSVHSHKPLCQLQAPSSLRFFLMLDYACGLRHLRKGYSSCKKATTRLRIHGLIRPVAWLEVLVPGEIS